MIKEPKVGQIVYAVEQPSAMARMYIGRIAAPLDKYGYVLVNWEYPLKLSHWYYKPEDLYESPVDATHVHLAQIKEQLDKEGAKLVNGEQFLRELEEKRSK